MMEAVLTEQQQNVLMLSAITLYWRDAPCRVSMLCCALFHINSQEMTLLICFAYLSQIRSTATAEVYLNLLLFLLVPTMSVGPTSSASALLKG